MTRSKRNNAVQIHEVVTPSGIYHLAATVHGLRALHFPSQPQFPRQGARTDTRISSHLMMAEAYLLAYLARQPLPQIPEVDLTWCTHFGAAVYTALRMVPFGSTITYGELAFKVGSPGGARAVGRCMGRNELPLFIPCHRVVSGNGALGGWSGPEGMKEWLLSHERPHR